MKGSVNVCAKIGDWSTCVCSDLASGAGGLAIITSVSCQVNKKRRVDWDRGHGTEVDSTVAVQTKKGKRG